MKLRGLKKEHYFNEIAPKDNQTCIEVTNVHVRLEAIKVLLVFVFFYLENKTFSQRHCHDEQFFFFVNLKNSIDRLDRFYKR